MTTRTQRRTGGARRTRQTRGGSREKAASAIAEHRIDELRPYQGNARTHSRRQIRQIANSIDRFGFTNPVLIADDDTIIAGHGRVLAATQLGMREVPTVRLSHMNEAERRAYILADNKLALNAGWDQELLAIELQALVDLDFDVEVTGFSLAEIDFTLDAASERDVPGPAGPEDEIPDLPTTAISRSGDLWRCGRHRVLCGDARSQADYGRLLDGDEVALVFTDPPYNVSIDGHVSGLGKVRHREFSFASGEMSEGAFIAFLTETLGAAADRCRDGAIAFVCMDWRHMGELLAAGRTVFDEMKNLCVWNKTNGGMGAFYRSKHELVFVFKVSSGPHVNSFGLGETGRYRTNVWDYAGINSFGASRDQDLAMHPTVKPVALVADAIRDCSRRGDTVLDPFGGSGTTPIPTPMGPVRRARSGRGAPTGRRRRDGDGDGERQMSGERDCKGAPPARRPRPQKRDAWSGDDDRVGPEGDRRDDGDGDDYEVGFGKPPRSTRFKKGQSGNPRGRPKKPKPKPIELADAPSDYFLEQEAYRLLKFRENGEEVELPASQAVVRSAIMSALKGNRLSQRYVIEHLEQKEAARQQLKIERYRRLEAAKRDGQQVLAACRRSGKPEPELLPHPDDVILDPNTLDARLIGPSSTAEARRCAHRIALRAHLLHRAAHADRYGATRFGSSIATGRSGWLLLAQILNLGLPPRLQWTDQDMTSALMRYAALPKRENARQIETEGERLAHEWQEMKSLPPELERQIKELVGQVMPAAMD